LHTPSISIIIINFNTVSLLKQCLDSVYAKTEDISYEIMVVDNASSDGSYAMLRKEFPEVHLIQNQENRGFAAANNQAIPLANGEYIVLLNSDTVLLNNALKIMYDFMASYSSAGICGPQLLNPDGSIQKSVAEFPTMEKIINSFIAPVAGKELFVSKYDPIFFDYTTQKEISGAALTGACLMIRKKLFNELGLLDENYFFYLEEADWSLSAIKKGWEIWLVANAKVMHHHMASVKQNRNDELKIKIKTGQVKSLQYFYRKHYSQPQAVLLRVFLLFFFLANLFRRAIEFLMTGRKNKHEKYFKIKLATKLLLSVFC